MRSRLLVVCLAFTAVIIPVSLAGCGNSDSGDDASAGAGGSSAAGTGGTNSGGSGGAATGGAGASGEGPGGSSGAGGAAGSGGSAGSGTGGGGGAAGAASFTTTSAMCGGIPILGQQGANNTPECVSCVNTSCCAQATTCSGDAECVAFRDCAGACTDAACSQQCASDHMAGTTSSTAFSTCRNQTCAKECQALACLGTVTAQAPTSATYKITIKPSDFQTGKAIPSLTIKQCPRSDTDCASPVATATTDATGVATFDAVTVGDKGLDDYFEFSGASYQPTLLFDIGSSAHPSLDGGTLNPLIISTQTWTLLTGVISVTPDATRGAVTFLTQSCTGDRAAGVSVAADTADAMSTLAYIAGSLPSKTATESDSSGTGAFINVPAGPITLKGTLVSTSQTIGQNAFFIRAGYISSTNVIPTP